MKRIALIDFDGTDGGAERLLLILYGVLKSHNIKVKLWSRNSGYTHRFIDRKDQISLVDILRERRFDFILYNNKRALILLPFLKLFKSRRVKHIYYAHSYLSSFDKVAYNIINSFISKSVFVSQDLHDSYPGRNKEIIYNGIRIIKNKSVVRKNAEMFNICFWAQLRPWKGHLILLEAFEKVLKTKQNAHLHIFYTTRNLEDINLLTEMRLKSRKISNVHLHEDEEDYLQTINSICSLAVSASTLRDPFPTIILEAFSLRLPIIATRVGGCSEMLNHAEEFLTSPNSSDLSRKILAFSELPLEERVRIGEKNYHRLAQEYSIERFTRAWTRIFSND